MNEASVAGRPGPGREPRGAGNLGVPTLGRVVVDRHGGRVLNPATAVLAPGARPPSATSYRSNTLLIPDSLLRDPAAVTLIETRLARVGLTIVIPPPIQEALPSLRPWLKELRDLPRAVVLRVRDDAPPTSVDAWTALQALRAEPRTTRAADEGATGGAASAEHPADIVSRIGLDHLLYAAILGDPASDPHDADGTSALADVSAAAVFTGNSRIPVRILSAAPHRTPVDRLGAARRPVVAVLDSGVRFHPWLGVPDNGPDAFWTTDDAMQDAIHRSELGVRAVSGLDIPVLTGAVDVHDVPGPTVGLLDDHIGHGTFIAGVIRQSAPDARVRMIRVMHTDGVVQEQVLLTALYVLAAQVATALAADDLDGMVDVVSLSLGYYEETPDDFNYTNLLADAVKKLCDLGVAVVASAGNDATEYPSLPAALSTRPGGDPMLPVLGVGALNPNGTKAMFSNDGPWVTAWAAGADVISTYPVDLDGGEQPVVAPSPADSRLARHRETLDPDGFRGGFAVWSGTSFAAPRVAAALAAELLEQARERPGEPDCDLGNTDRQAARQRASGAIKRVSTHELA
jgi:hypothetical protein